MPEGNPGAGYGLELEFRLELLEILDAQRDLSLKEAVPSQRRWRPKSGTEERKTSDLLLPYTLGWEPRSFQFFML